MVYGVWCFVSYHIPYDTWTLYIYIYIWYKPGTYSINSLFLHVNAIILKNIK